MELQQSRQPFDLAERTFQFASSVRKLVKQLPRSLGNLEDARQLIRASGSVGANYIEANEGLGEKRFLMHIKIACKEAKESHYWLRLVDLAEKSDLEASRNALLQEASELVLIFAAIIRKRS
jgi:four helix bundle protein